MIGLAFHHASERKQKVYWREKIQNKNSQFPSDWICTFSSFLIGDLLPFLLNFNFMKLHLHTIFMANFGSFVLKWAHFILLNELFIIYVFRDKERAKITHVLQSFVLFVQFGVDLWKSFLRLIQFIFNVLDFLLEWTSFFFSLQFVCFGFFFFWEKNEKKFKSFCQRGKKIQMRMEIIFRDSDVKVSYLFSTEIGITSLLFTDQCTI